MQMSDVFFWTRVINFTWGFALFMFLVYYGALDVLLSRRCKTVHVPKEMRFWAAASLAGVVALLMSLGEIFLKEATGGYRVFFIWPFLALVSISLIEGADRVRQHKRMIATGECK